jgi:integrase
MGRTAGVNLTKSEIEALEPKEKVYLVPDAKTRGLNIQVTPNNVRSWVLRFRVHGRQKMHSLGRWPELTVDQARKIALKKQAEIADGKDPATKRRAEREAKTMAELVKKFKEDHLPTLKPNSRTQYERLLDKRILPALGHMRAKDVQPSDIAALLSKIRASTEKGIEANRTRAVLSKMFTLSAVWGFRTDLPNPAQGQARAPEIKKDRHLSDKELLALGATLRHLDPTNKKRPADALPAEDRHALAALRLALLTGMRKSEIIGDAVHEIPGLTWDAVDLEAGRIRLDNHKTSGKSGSRIVSLCSAAVTLLKHVPKVKKNPYVIPGSLKGESLVGLQKIWERVRDAVSKVQEKAEVPKAERVSLGDVTIHDLRRSFASVAARMGYPELIVAALLGHAAGSVTAGYARLGADPLRDHVEAIGGRMAALLDGKVNLAAEAKALKAQAKAKNGQRAPQNSPKKGSQSDGA